MTEILLSLGSNLGNRQENILKAIELLRIRVFKGEINISSIYETEPVGFIDQPLFLNLAVSGLTSLPPLKLLEHCKTIEIELGRKQREHWHEREIDIDIILYGSEIINCENLIIPHANLQYRKFVLLPCSEIAGNMIHPGLGLTIKYITDICRDTGEVNYFLPLCS